jgi:cleavage and polyadenylation specificity factor subunit 3
VSEPTEITALSGQKIPRRMSVEEISFAAHVDYTHNSHFIEKIDANHIVLSPLNLCLS